MEMEHLAGSCVRISPRLDLVLHHHRFVFDGRETLVSATASACSSMLWDGLVQRRPKPTFRANRNWKGFLREHPPSYL
jgi:hypothetical protein